MDMNRDKDRDKRAFIRLNSILKHAGALPVPDLNDRPIRQCTITPDEIVNLKIDLGLCNTVGDVEKLVAAR